MQAWMKLIHEDNTALIHIWLTTREQAFVKFALETKRSMEHALRHSMTAVVIKTLGFLTAAVAIIQIFNIMYGNVNVLPSSRLTTPSYNQQSIAAVAGDDSADEKKFIKAEVDLKEVESKYEQKEVSKKLVKPEVAE
jgi:hypothetical protein